MTCKSIVKSSLVLCIAAILVIALCGCEDLGAYDDVEEYYGCFGDVVFIDAATGEVEEYSVEDYFYNEESRDDFLKGEDGAYQGVEHSEYVYVAIPFESNINMDSLALYIQSLDDVTVYINVFLTDVIPSAWRGIGDNVIPDENSGDTSDDASGGENSNETPGSEGGGEGSDETADDESGEKTEETYDDPDPNSRIGEIVVHIRNGEWSSFVLDFFNVNGTAQNSIQIEEGQYLLLQIRNNSGVRIFDTDKQIYVDPQTGLELPKAKITMTNLLVRALEVRTDNEE
jgi:hypothetical protein